MIELEQVSRDIWTIEGFLSPQKCSDLILLSEHIGYSQATVSLPECARFMKGLRNNDRVQLNDPKFAAALYSKLLPSLPVLESGEHPIGLYEHFRFYRYSVDQRFKRHIDGRVNVDGRESRVTLMLYLNDDYQGGETKFSEITIEPKTGMALMFIHELKHESTPITTGQKYVLRTDIFYQ